jgi:hypothetical protein
MLLIHCPNCEHDNTPGERFCAVCGVPLDLKPCPQCGKVDQITAKVCSGCGAAFPPIVLAHVDGKSVSVATPVAQAHEARLPSQEPAQPPAGGNRAWPLILVAIAAGGIPLLWMNRAHMPLPKAWQIQAPNAVGSAAVSVSAPAPQPELPAAAPALAPEVPKPDQPAANRDTEMTPSAPVQDKTPAKQAPQKAPAKHHAAKAVHPPKATAATATASSQPCTEAMAALNLCDPKATQK